MTGNSPHQEKSRSMNMVDGDQAESVRETWHTPGPWHVCNGASHLIADSHFMTVAEARQIVSGNLRTGRTEYVPGHRMQEANARLIAAAPELLEEGQRVVRCDVEEFAEYSSTEDTVTLQLSHVDWEAYRHAIRQLKAAIAKATSPRVGGEGR